MPPQRAQLTPRGRVAGPNVGTQRSPNCSPYKRNMSLGSRQCPNRYARAPPVRHCRRSLISISTNCSPSSHPVASGEIENGLSARTASARACPGGCTGTSRAPLRQTRGGRVARRAGPSYALPGQASGTASRGSQISNWGSSSYCRKGSTSGRRLTGASHRPSRRRASLSVGMWKRLLSSVPSTRSRSWRAR